jgi:hypothetical protein
MTTIEFDRAIDRLYREFPSAKLTAGKKEIIWNGCGHLPEFNFNKIVNHFIATFRQPPLPKDFLDAARAESARTKYTHEPNAPAEPAKCDWCCDGGVMEVIAKHNKRTYFIRCECIEGAHSFRTELIQWHPLMSENFDRIDMKRDGYKKWKPRYKFNPDDPQGSLHDQVEIWKLQMKVSVAFWDDLKPDTPA